MRNFITPPSFASDDQAAEFEALPGRRERRIAQRQLARKSQRAYKTRARTRRAQVSLLRTLRPHLSIVRDESKPATDRAKAMSKICQLMDAPDNVTALSMVEALALEVDSQ